MSTRWVNFVPWSAAGMGILSVTVVIISGSPISDLPGADLATVENSIICILFEVYCSPGYCSG